MRDIDVTRELCIRNTDSVEWHSILLSYFAGASYPAANVQRFGTCDGPRFLQIEYTKKGGIRRAITDLTDGEIADLSRRIANDLIENQTQRVAQRICFSHEWIRGAFRYKDLFQIIRARADFPDAPVIIADHPFLFQFRFRSSPNPFISQMRAGRLLVQYVRYLNVLSKSGVEVGPRSTRFAWCIDPETTFSQSNLLKSRWMQEGYVAHRA